MSPLQIIASTLLQPDFRSGNVSTLKVQGNSNARRDKKWGISASVRIPAAITRAASLSLDDVVDVREEGGSIVILPIRPSEFDLAQLLAEITLDNLRTEISLGNAVANEVC